MIKKGNLGNQWQSLISSQTISFPNNPIFFAWMGEMKKYKDRKSSVCNVVNSVRIDFESSQRTLGCDADGHKLTYLATRAARGQK